MSSKLWFILFMGVVVMSSNVQAVDKDEAEIRSAINGFSVFADHGAFSYLARVLAPEVELDYRSIFGGEPERVQRIDLMKRWMAFLPGFDKTFHNLSSIRVSIEGSRANAAANFTASHWLGQEGYWSIDGQYRFGLTKLDGHWLIDSVVVELQGEEGSREILQQAPSLAGAKHRLRQSLLPNEL